ncbi:hypothetical protein [Streptomyces sp. NPDC050121]|uniref:hypothetical protein n=1 Tax=Streptomyces sp. NPDC050121 TaxID=3365601 RepID=UPI00379EE589
MDTGTQGPGRLVRFRVENSAGAGGGAAAEHCAPLLSSGHGLTGMRERTALYGGSVAVIFVYESGLVRVGD